MSRSTSIEINLSAIDANLRSLKESAGSQKLMAVVKANAYGHGASAGRPIEDTVDAFAVAFTEEAVELRESGIAAPVLVLEGPHTPSELSIKQARPLAGPASSGATRMVHQARQPTETRWIKVDTGMHGWDFRHRNLQTSSNGLVTRRSRT